MKLLRLELLAYGSLKGVELDFSSREPCLHVVYGANEAGKSTALRAISSLFYGIPESTPDVHSLKGPELRIGALLRDARGRELHVIRRKGRKDTLRAASGEALEGADASWLTAGVSEATFRSLFGLSFATLHEGADELLGNAGDLGQSLYSAAVGGSRVRALMDALRGEAEQLFKPRGQTQKLNVALKQFEDAKRRSREQAMQASAYSEQQAAIEEAQREDERLQVEHLALRTERGRLERARRVIPLLDKQRELSRERASLADVPRLANDAPEQRRRVETARKEAALRVEHVQGEIALHDQELAALSFDTALAELDGALIDQLRDRLGGYRRSKAELPRRVEALTRARHEVARALAQLGLPADHAPLEQLRVSKPLEARLREQVRLGDKLQAELREHARVRVVKQAELERQRLQLVQLWAADQAESPDLWTRSSLPSDETAEEFERKFEALDQAERAWADRRVQVQAALEQQRCELETSSLSGAPPTDAELSQLRVERAASWSKLRAALSPDAERRSGDSRPLTLLEQAIALTEQSDALADRLRREASRVAEHARLSAELQSSERGLLQLEQERVALDDTRAQLSAKWHALFQRAAVAARSPRETRRLLIEQRTGEARCQELERELATLERALRSCSELEQRWRAAWRELSSELGVSEHASASEIDALLDGRAELLQRHDRSLVIARELSELEQELRSFENDALALCARHVPAAGGELPIDSAADQLIRRHQATHAALARRQQLTAALDSRRLELAQVQAAYASAERELSSLLAAANVSDLPALEAAELGSARNRHLDATLAELHDELLTASDGISAELVLADAPASLDEVRARIAAIDEMLEELDREHRRVAQTLASRRAGLDRLRESHGASEAAFEAALQLEAVRGLAEQYVRTRLAASVLKREVDRYRERNKGAILRAAGNLFERLTLASFSGLDIDYTHSDEPVLTCVRSDGARVGVEGLSTGTRDQLYLALRLASIEHLAERQELMPLVLDDILVHFDDERARAALGVLAAFADTTQVLLFTHHRRLCELAQTLPSGRVRMLNMGGARPTIVPLYT